MKFWNEENKDGIIGNYKKDENSIIISYLDGTTEKILLSRENEQKILDLMLYQARLKSDLSEYLRVSEVKSMTFYTTLISGIATLTFGLFGYAVSLRDMDGLASFSNIISMVTGITVVINGIMYSSRSEELDEIIILDLYLSSKNEIEKYLLNDQIFEGVVSEQRILNINTIDDFSADDIKKILLNIKALNSEENILPSHDQVFGLARKRFFL